MVSFDRESSLLPPVRKALRSRGYRRQKDEVQFYEYRMDLYGYDQPNNTTSAVELKLKRWSRAFEQALVYQLCADFVYMALPDKNCEKVDHDLLSRHGLGLIGVHRNGNCEILLNAEQSKVILPHYKQFYVKLMKARSA